MIVLLDMDGVLVDFVTPVLEAHNLTDYDPQGEWDFCKLYPMTKQEFWAPISSAEWWENLSPDPDINFFMHLTEKHFRRIVSSPSGCEGAMIGKQRWVKKYIPHLAPAILTGEKWLLAGWDTLLIDDRDDFVDGFREAGGMAVLVPRPWNSNRGLDLRTHVEKEFKRYERLHHTGRRFEHRPRTEDAGVRIAGRPPAAQPIPHGARGV
jgi:hypothetical protein